MNADLDTDLIRRRLDTDSAWLPTARQDLTNLLDEVELLRSLDDETRAMLNRVIVDSTTEIARLKADNNDLRAEASLLAEELHQTGEDLAELQRRAVDAA